MSSSTMPGTPRALGAAKADVLVVGDDDAGCEGLQAGLELLGHRVVARTLGSDTVVDAATLGTEIVIISSTELERPEILCARLRKGPITRSLAVLVIVASSHEHMRIRAFEAGADDVVVRPFSMRELSLRVRVLVERRRPQAKARFKYGLLTVDLPAHRAFVAGTEVVLTRREFDVLARLCAQCDHPVSRDALFDGIWGASSDLDVRTVDAHISRLKFKLGPAGRYIRSVRSFGYVLDPCRRAAR